MKRTILVLTVGAALVASLATPALAGRKAQHQKANRRKIVFTGVVTSATSGSLTVDVKRGNKAAKKLAAANDGDLVVSLDGTKFRPRSISSGTDIRVGDRVAVLAVSGEEDELVARRVLVKHRRAPAPVPTDDEQAPASPA